MDRPWLSRPMYGDFCPPAPALDRGRFAGDHFGRFPAEVYPLFSHETPPPFDRPAPPMPFPPPAPRGPQEPWIDPVYNGRESFRHGLPPPQGFFDEEILERDSPYKRMRVEESASGNFPPTLLPYNRFGAAPPSRISLENERRLNLIRDHGRETIAEGLHHWTGEYRKDRLPYEDHAHSFSVVGADGGFGDSGIGYVGRNDLIQGNASNRYGNHGVDVGPHNLGSASIQERKNHGDGSLSHESRYHGDPLRRRSDFGQDGAYIQHLGESNVQSDAHISHPQSYEPSFSGTNLQSNVARAFRGEPRYESQQHVLYPNSSYMSGGPHKSHYDSHRFEQTDSAPNLLPEQPWYDDIPGYRMPPRLATSDKKSSYAVWMAQNPVEDMHSQHPGAMHGYSEQRPLSIEDITKPFHRQTHPVAEHPSVKAGGAQESFLQMPGRSYASLAVTEGHVQGTPCSHPFLQPPTTAVHAETSLSDFNVMPSPPTAKSTLFPVLSSSSAATLLPPRAGPMVETHSLPQSNSYNVLAAFNSSHNISEGLPSFYQAPSEQHRKDGGQTHLANHSLIAKTIAVNACHLFKQPHRASRPDHIVVILRGLPGSGKSYLAKALRDLEVENGGNAPRIHAMDDYFMIEVEKEVEDNDGSKSSGSLKGKKQLMKKVIEYCYEPEMEETYRSSMLKAFRKTLDEGIFTFVIVDDRNLRVADFAQFWATAKRSGYEVYLLEAPYKDPMGCAARNVHGFTVDGIQKMAKQWEEAPPLYLQLDIQSLFHGDDLNEHSIEEVDMDTDDVDCVDNRQNIPDREYSDQARTEAPDHNEVSDLSKPRGGWDSEEEEEELAKELGRSKWSKDLDEDAGNSDHDEENPNALSGLIQAYGKNEKSVRWGDRVEGSGFSIGAVKRRTSLIIGSGSGYNLNANPLGEEDDTAQAKRRSNTESTRRFNEQLRAERETFKAVFDRRRQRIGGLNDAEDE